MRLICVMAVAVCANHKLSRKPRKPILEPELSMRFNPTNERDEVSNFDSIMDVSSSDSTESIYVESTNVTDPMNPLYCCDEPKKCLCEFGCIDQNYTCPVDIVVAVDVCHCDNTRWIKTIEFIVHLVEELKEKILDFRFSIILFNDIQETMISLDNWRPEWTLAEVYEMIENYDLAQFYGRGTVLHTGLEYAYKQFDHELKRKALLVLYSNGLSQSTDRQVLDVTQKYPGPDVIAVTANSLNPKHCSGAMCPNDLLHDIVTGVLVDGSGRRQFWAAKEVRNYVQNSFTCTQQACEMLDCDCNFKCNRAFVGPPDSNCEICEDIPCPVDVVIAIDMCTCDEKRFQQAQNFITTLADKLVPLADQRNQKVRLSVVQFNELAIRTSQFAEFNVPPSTESLAAFREQVEKMTVDAFRGMGTNLTAGLAKAEEVFIEDGMTEADRLELRTDTNKTEKILLLYTNGNSEDSRKKIMNKVIGLKAQNIHILPLSVSSRETECYANPVCPDSKFLDAIKDEELDNYLDSTKVDEAIDTIDEFMQELTCGDNSCEEPCPRPTPTPETKGPVITCKSPNDEVYKVGTNEAIKPNSCPAMNVAFIIDGSDSITGRPNGGQWKVLKNWVWEVIAAFELESRPAISYVAVMQYAHNTELLGQKWWPIGCDPYNFSTEDLKAQLLDWRQMNTTTNTYKATNKLMESYDTNYVAYLNANPFSLLILVTDGEHRDTYRRNKATIKELKGKFDLIQVVSTNGYFQNKDDWEKATTEMTLNEKPKWDQPEFDFLKNCVSTCNARNAPLRNIPDISQKLQDDFLEKDV